MTTSVMGMERPLYPPISRATVGACRTMVGAHRICFATTHRDQPRRRGDPPYVGTLRVPFLSGIQQLLSDDGVIRDDPRQNDDGSWWWQIKDEDSFSRIDAWVRSQGTRVFLRDCLEISVALSMNIATSEGGKEGHTRLGAFEARAKAIPDEEATGCLVTSFVESIRALAGYRAAKFIAAVPPSPGKPYDLPSVLAARIAQALSITDLTAQFRFAQPKDAVKEAKVEEKWDKWERSGLTFAPSLQGRPAVIVIDDKYQSGITLQYVASVLRASGAGALYGMCAVKTLRDTDNA